MAESEPTGLAKFFKVLLPDTSFIGVIQNDIVYKLISWLEIYFYFFYLEPAKDKLSDPIFVDKPILIFHGLEIIDITIYNAIVLALLIEIVIVLVINQVGEYNKSIY